MGSKSNRSRRYTEEFKRDAVALVRSSGKTVTEAAREIGASAEGLRNWAKQDEIDPGPGMVGAGFGEVVGEPAGGVRLQRRGPSDRPQPAVGVVPAQDEQLGAVQRAGDAADHGLGRLAPTDLEPPSGSGQVSLSGVL
ncbi:transposase [Streptomyces sp. NPDC054802]